MSDIFCYFADMGNNTIKKIRKQTYPFKTILIGESFRVSDAKYNSMLTSFRQHNKKHPDMAIEIKSEPASKGFQCVTRIA